MNNTAGRLGQAFGALIVAVFATYFLIYPAIYFVWNFAIEGIGFSQYKIPDFWVGMAFFFIFNVTKNIIKGVFK